MATIADLGDQGYKFWHSVSSKNFFPKPAEFNLPIVTLDYEDEAIEEENGKYYGWLFGKRIHLIHRGPGSTIHIANLLNKAKFPLWWDDLDAIHYFLLPSNISASDSEIEYYKVHYLSELKFPVGLRNEARIYVLQYKENFEVYFHDLESFYFMRTIPDESNLSTQQ
jgi:hypothetical protein